MNILEAQREMRSAFLGGFAGQLVSGLIWLIAAALAAWVSPGYGMAALLVVAGAGPAPYGPPTFSLGGWLAGVVLIGFASAGRHVSVQEETR